LLAVESRRGAYQESKLWRDAMLKPDKISMDELLESLVDEVDDRD